MMFEGSGSELKWAKGGLSWQTEISPDEKRGLSVIARDQANGEQRKRG